MYMSALAIVATVALIAYSYLLGFWRKRIRVPSDLRQARMAKFSSVERRVSEPTESVPTKNVPTADRFASLAEHSDVQAQDASPSYVL